MSISVIVDKYLIGTSRSLKYKFASADLVSENQFIRKTLIWKSLKK